MDFSSDEWSTPPHPNGDEPTTREKKKLSLYPQAASFLDLPPEIRNEIYLLVLAKPSKTTILLDDNWKQPALSLTCHQLQREVVSFWLGYYKCSFWPNRHGQQFCFSPLMKKWMTRAGPDAFHIHHLEVNARMPDHSRFCWEVKLDRDSSARGTVRRVSLGDIANAKATAAQVPISVKTKSKRGKKAKDAIRRKSLNSVVKPRNYSREAVVAKELCNAVFPPLEQNRTGCIGVVEVEKILSVLKKNGLSVPGSLDEQNPSWSAENSDRYRSPSWLRCPATSVISKAGGVPRIGRFRRRRNNSPLWLKAKTRAVALRHISQEETGHSAVKKEDAAVSPFALPTKSEVQFVELMSKLSLTHYPALPPR